MDIIHQQGPVSLNYLRKLFAVDYQACPVADSPLLLTTTDDTCHYGNQSPSFCQAPLVPGENFDILKSAALFAGICPDQSCPENPVDRGTKRKNIGYYGDTSVESALEDTIWTQSGYCLYNDTGFQGDVESDFEYEDGVYTASQYSPPLPSNPCNELDGNEQQRKRFKHSCGLMSSYVYEPNTAQQTDFELSTYSNCFEYGIDEGQLISAESEEQHEYRGHDVLVPGTNDIRNSDAFEPTTIHYNVIENTFTFDLDGKTNDTSAEGGWMDEYYDGEWAEFASEDSSESDTSLESSISGSHCSSFSDSDSDHDSDNDSFYQEDESKWSSDSESSDSDSDNDSSDTKEESECHSLKDSSLQSPGADESTPAYLQLLKYYLSRKDSSIQTKCSNSLSSELWENNDKYEIQRDLDEPQSDLDMDISTDELGEEEECPSSCICKTGKSETPPKTKRKFRVLEPLYKKVLQRRAMRHSNRYSYACCERNCSLKRWRSVHMWKLKTDYHESDLRVSHYNWGDWEEEEELLY